METDKIFMYVAGGVMIIVVGFIVYAVVVKKDITAAIPPVAEHKDASSVTPQHAVVFRGS